MKKQLFFHAKKCPVHPDEILKFKGVLIKLPNFQERMNYTLENYCPQCDKYLVKGKMTPLQETAVLFVNHNYNKNYTISEVNASTLEKISV